VFEAAPALREAGAGLNLWVNGMVALDDLGVADRVMGLGEPIEVQESRTRRGRVLSRVPVGAMARRHGLLPPAVLRRADLLACLADAVSDDAVHVGARCTGFAQEEGGVALRLDDGREVTGSFLIGADGIGSAVRAQLAPAVRIRYAGYQSFRGLTQHDAADLIPGTFLMAYGRGDRFGVSRAGHGRLWWFGVMPRPEEAPDRPDGRKHEVLEHFSRFAAPVAGVIEATDEADILRNPVRDILPMTRWGAGRVTLAGDAAHAMTVGAGRGASEAIQDAVVLSRHLRGCHHGEVPAALRSYELERMGPTAQIQQRSWQFGVSASWSDPLRCTIRDLLTQTTWRRRAEQGTEAELARLERTKAPRPG
jgi:2-polyprenyl-6-methoxyphenol hydroxylase-like FAD-dependent oxidoreductase